MELSPSDKGRIEHQFDSFCKLVLVCEMKDYKKMILRKMAKEILFSELILIYGYDLEHKKVGQEEIKDIFSIKVMGFDITIKNMLIAEAVLSLTEKGRKMCEVLGISTKTGYRLLREKKICCLKVGRAYRIPKAHLFTYLCIGGEETSI